MSTSDNAPPYWSHFVQLSRQFAPNIPGEQSTPLQQDVAAVGRAAGIFQALASAGGIDVYDAVSLAASGGTQTNISGAVDAVTDELIGSGVKHIFNAEAGLIGAGVIMLLRGGHQSLSRSSETATYLLTMLGYTTTMARACVEALYSTRPYTRSPNPPIPPFIHEQGDLFSDWRERAFLNGYRKFGQLVQSMDNIRPTDSGEAWRSKMCLMHIAITSGATGSRNMSVGRTFRRCEQIIMSELLSTDLRVIRERLRRWGNAS